MKTIYDWIEMIPCDTTRVKAHALTATSRKWAQTDSFTVALAHAFDWSSTSEGHNFWQQVCENMIEMGMNRFTLKLELLDGAPPQPFVPAEPPTDIIAPPEYAGYTVVPYNMAINPPTPKPSDTQVGGSHYKNMVIQPVEFCQRNGLGYCEANAVKYLCRWREKNGLQDLQKAMHYIQLLIEMEYPEEAGK